jgi:two-component system, LytTR family, response regulator
MTTQIYTCYVVDDQKAYAQEIAQYIRETPGLQLQGISHSPLEALRRMEQNPPDILFADINMPQMSGLDLAQRLALLDTQVIFMSSHEEYALKAFELAASHYLMKPVNYDKFLQAVQRAVNILRLKRSSSDKGVPLKESILLMVKGKEQEVAFDDIYYIEANNNAIIVWLKDNSLPVNMTLTEFEKKLPKEKFFQSHRSFIVAKLHIKRIESMQLILTNDKAVPVSRSYIGQIKQQVFA